MVHPIEEQIRLVEELRDQVITKGFEKPLDYEELKAKKDKFMRDSRYQIRLMGDEDAKRRMNGIFNSQVKIINAFMDAKGRGALTQEMITDLMNEINYFIGKSKELIGVKNQYGN